MRFNPILSDLIRFNPRYLWTQAAAGQGGPERALYISEFARWCAENNDAPLIFLEGLADEILKEVAALKVDAPKPSERKHIAQSKSKGHFQGAETPGSHDAAKSRGLPQHWSSARAAVSEQVGLAML